jgi:uncharacterized protein (DUF488 family)
MLPPIVSRPIHRSRLASTPCRPQVERVWEPVWTIGHSTRSLEEFVAALRAYDVELVADVRRFPGSRRLPHFGAEELERSLAEDHVAYHWYSALGGRRRPDPASVNIGWRHPAFRAYADHVASAEFADGLFELLMAAQGLRTAVMCSEILWWRCHRRLIADVLTSLGVRVVHIRDARTAEVHRLVAPALIAGGRLTYATRFQVDA